MRYLLNSAVITGPGRYWYRLIDIREMVVWVLAGGWVSRIGYPATAAHIERLAGVPVPVSREQTTMLPGDEALIVRLKYRVTDPSQKAGYQPGPDDWEYGILTREGDGA